MQKITIEEIFRTESPLKGERVTNVIPVNGGCIHDAWCLDLETGRQLFAKTTSVKNSSMLQFEAKGLDVLSQAVNTSYIKVPKPLSIQEIKNTSILILPWFNLLEGDEKKLGHGLALLHKETSKNNTEGFGWGEDGFIGNNPQIGGWESTWGECFVNLRLIPQMKIATKWGLNFDNKKVLSKITNFLNEHEPLPSLVHGDLWKGNAATNKTGEGVLFDPAVWWADREVDIAMTKLFGGFSKQFYSSYEEVFPLSSSFHQRIEIYNLYHLLNHANLFGGYYKHECLSILKRLDNIL
ncbi:fructosamine kinase family protein [Prochlorococcus marinus]|uniref:fructosamine kinase family protein n=1 Tax=Prochlorococcus marinus TaxID=1219 RepID=UPI0022B44A35|nr:fructosamine kinase family protein [Prochlorococcus marinus]